LYFGTNGINRGFIESGGGWTLDGAVTLNTVTGTAGTTAGSNDRILVATSAGIISQISFAAFSAATNASWGLTGNATDASPFGATPLGSAFSTYPGTEYIGTSNLTRLYFGTNGINRGFIESSGGWSLDGPLTFAGMGGAAGTSMGSNDRVLVATSAGAVSQVSLATLSASMGWSLSGNPTADSWNGTSGARLGTTSTQPLVLATTNATAQDIRFFTGASGANERMRIAGDGLLYVGITTGPTGQFNIASGASTRPGLVVRAAASQSANIVEVQNSGGTVLTSVSNEGSVSVGGHIAATPGTPATVAADNTAITVGAKSFLRITSNGTPANRTITLSNGLTDGQILVIRVSGGGTAANGIELADAGNLVLTGTAQLTDGSTIVLIWDSATSWFELMRSIN
jgi:hypothetical protein